jgi:hypothetical protein
MRPECYKNIKISILSAGQPRPYADSIYKARIEYTYKPPLLNDPPVAPMSLSLDQVRQLTKLFIRNYEHEHNNANASFPYGLDSYAVFKEINKGIWEVTIVEPFTD